ncbi:hypothetical protein ILFOPFJJ_00865 [Ensifer psoraleae]|nr:hypothetical protein [Sinorhizobium psoraleae]
MLGHGSKLGRSRVGASKDIYESISADRFKNLKRRRASAPFRRPQRCLIRSDAIDRKAGWHRTLPVTVRRVVFHVHRLLAEAPVTLQVRVSGPSLRRPPVPGRERIGKVAPEPAGSNSPKPRRIRSGSRNCTALRTTSLKRKNRAFTPLSIGRRSRSIPCFSRLSSTRRGRVSCAPKGAFGWQRGPTTAAKSARRARWCERARSGCGSYSPELIWSAERSVT